ncbi:hypothetical protein D3C78_1468540 [compost metagenome]
MAGSDHQLIHRQHLAAQFDGGHRAIGMANPGHGLPQSKLAATGSLQACRQLQAKAMAIADFFIRGVNRSHKRRIGQGGVKARALGLRQHLLLLRIGKAAAGMVEACGLAKGHQFAVAPPVETAQ